MDLHDDPVQRRLRQLAGEESPSTEPSPAAPSSSSSRTTGTSIGSMITVNTESSEETTARTPSTSSATSASTRETGSTIHLSQASTSLSEQGADSPSTGPTPSPVAPSSRSSRTTLSATGSLLTVNSQSSEASAIRTASTSSATSSSTQVAVSPQSSTQASSSGAPFSSEALKRLRSRSDEETVKRRTTGSRHTILSFEGMQNDDGSEMADIEFDVPAAEEEPEAQVVAQEVPGEVPPEQAVEAQVARPVPQRASTSRVELIVFISQADGHILTTDPAITDETMFRVILAEDVTATTVKTVRMTPFSRERLRLMPGGEEAVAKYEHLRRVCAGKLPTATRTQGQMLQRHLKQAINSLRVTLNTIPTDRLLERYSRGQVDDVANRFRPLTTCPVTMTCLTLILQLLDKRLAPARVKMSANQINDQYSLLQLKLLAHVYLALASGGRLFSGAN